MRQQQCSGSMRGKVPGKGRASEQVEKRESVCGMKGEGVSRPVVNDRSCAPLLYAPDGVH